MDCFCKCHLNAGPCCKHCKKLEIKEIYRQLMLLNVKFSDAYADLSKRLHVVELELFKIKKDLEEKDG